MRSMNRFHNLRNGSSHLRHQFYACQSNRRCSLGDFGDCTFCFLSEGFNRDDGITENGGGVPTLRHKIERAVAILSVGINEGIGRQHVLAVQAGKY